MKISPVGLSFKARAVSNTTLGTHRTRHNEGMSQKEIIAHYYNQIEKIHDQMQKAIDLRSFMNSPEVTKILNKLPEEDEVEEDSLLKTNAGINGFNTLEPNKMMLYYVPKTATTHAKIYSYDSDKNRYRKFGEKVSNHFNIVVQGDDGRINKVGIINWLNEIVDILKG